MKIFVYEHITSGALCDQHLPENLTKEGDLMLMAILMDLKKISGIKLIILRDYRLVNNHLSNCNIYQHYTVTNLENFNLFWMQCLDEADAVLAIAPETEGVLATLQQKIIDRNKLILGSHPDAIKITTDKLLCGHKISKAGLACPPAICAKNWQTDSWNHDNGYIIKPIDGAGCENTQYFINTKKLREWLSDQTQNDLETLLIQNYVKGSSISLSLLVNGHDAFVLGMNKQLIKNERNQLIFTGCVVNGLSDDELSIAKAQSIAETVCQTIPGLWGFIGIDIILSETGPIIIDINPRLTTSYVGLHDSLAINPAELLLLMKDEGIDALPEITQRYPISIQT